MKSNQTKKNRMICCLITLFFIMAIKVMPLCSFAGMNSASVIVTSFERTSQYEAEADLYAAFLSPRKVVSKVELQSAVEGTTDYSTEEGPYSRTVYNTTSITRVLYFELEEGYDYRVKFQVSDTVDGVETTVTEYAYLEE